MMRLARKIFLVAGWWGILSLLPLLFAFDAIGSKSPPPITHPEYYFGFLSVALAWQVGFLVMARDPVRYRALMVPAMLEKFGYALACLVLLLQHRASGATAAFGGIDCLFGFAFVLAFRATTAASAGRGS
jgi:hypothetical protein